MTDLSDNIAGKRRIQCNLIPTEMDTTFRSAFLHLEMNRELKRESSSMVFLCTLAKHVADCFFNKNSDLSNSLIASTREVKIILTFYYCC